MKKIIKFIISVLIPLSVGYFSAFFSSDPISNWYLSLNKPPFHPPNWVFAPVWTILYITMGLSFYWVWKERELREIKEISLIYFVQLGLSFLWSILFFRLENPDVAFICLFFLLMSIFYLILKFYRLSRRAGYILIPYLLWVSFAGVLNFSIALLN